MKVIQIIGPSYSGSTVLGYSLNTIKGGFFGSEVRRLLKTSRESERRVPQCDLCGENCNYWRHAAIKRISEMDFLDDLYADFEKNNSDIDYFIDASKLPKYYENSHADYRVICVKHPMKLVASTLYNKKNVYKFHATEYIEFQKELIESAELESILDTIIRKIHKGYSLILRKFPDAIHFKNDVAHEKNFVAFRTLERFLDLPASATSPDQYSQYPCHSIGGNRAPVWISQGTESKDGKQARNRYYANAESFGDWRIDDKYKYVLGDSIMDVIEKNSTYAELLKIFSYDPISR